MDIDEVNSPPVAPAAEPVKRGRPKLVYRSKPPVRRARQQRAADETAWAFDPLTGARLRPSAEAPVTRAIPRGDTRGPVRERKRKGGQLADKFAFPVDQIPDGASYEWKTMTVYGKEVQGYDVEMREQGWLPVDSARHPSFMPSGYKGAIIRDGMVLMERPIELTREAEAENRLNARNAVRTKEQQLGNAPAGTAPRESPSGAIRPAVSRSYEPGYIDP